MITKYARKKKLKSAEGRIWACFLTITVGGGWILIRIELLLFDRSEFEVFSMHDHNERLKKQFIRRKELEGKQAKLENINNDVSSKEEPSHRHGTQLELPDICEGKEHFWYLLKDAGIEFQSKYCEYVPGSMETFPLWRETVSMYGAKPAIVKHCSKRGQDRPYLMPRIVGLFNTGTNALKKLLIANFKTISNNLFEHNATDKDWRKLPFWEWDGNSYLNLDEKKHYQREFQPNYNQDFSDDESSILRIIIVRDPYRWAQSTCRAKYDVKLLPKSGEHRNLTLRKKNDPKLPPGPRAQEKFKRLQLISSVEEKSNILHSLKQRRLDDQQHTMIANMVQGRGRTVGSILDHQEVEENFLQDKQSYNAVVAGKYSTFDKALEHQIHLDKALERQEQHAKAHPWGCLNGAVSLYEKKYNSIGHLWSSWLQEYLWENETIPFLALRFEDVLFHTDDVVAAIEDCSGLERIPPMIPGSSVNYVLGAGKDHGTKTLGFLSALAKNSKRRERTLRFRQEHLKYFNNDALDPNLMERFQYTYESEIM